MPMLIPVVVLLVWLIPQSSSSSSEFISPSAFLGDATQCNGIDYPFGVPNFTDFMEGFQIRCDPQSDNKTLHLGATQYKILEISLLLGYLRIEIPPIPWRCGRGFTDPAGPGLTLSLEGTPYTFNDTRNKFTVIGCDALVMFHFTAPTPTPTPTPTHGSRNSSGCASFCATPNSVIDGSCSGVGCCQAAVPSGLKSFRTEFSSIRNLTHSHFNLNNGSCTRAYLLEDEGFVFSAGDNMENSVVLTHSVVLDWAIDNVTCEVARARARGHGPSSFACKNNTVCINVSTGGYRCNCTVGYDGNPYVGCQDIDECGDPQTNPCVHTCENMQGAFHCSCPFGTTGDGKKQGTGCKRVQPFEIALSVGLGLLFILLMGSFWSYWLFEKRRAIKLKHEYFMQNGGLLLQQHISARQMAARIFSAEELGKATDDFNESRVVGRGGNGTVYKGILLDQRVVAIKKAKVVDQTQIEQFINEVLILSQMDHRNVVKLLGCCLETQVPLLVYEFISNGTLFHHVHDIDGSTASMSWENRLRIAVETAGAIAYLHSATPIPVIHRDIKSANILLNENFTAKVSDFGASRLLPYNQTHVTTLVQGTLGYLDPEYFQTGQLTEKSDVYSFGVVLVELLTKEKAISFCRSEGERNLVAYFISLVEKGRLTEVADRQIVREAGARHLTAVAQLARRCLSVRGDERPRMKEVQVELDALRRLMKQHWAEERQEKEGDDQGVALCPCSDDKTIRQYVGESHVSSDTSALYSMESHLLSSLDFPR